MIKLKFKSENVIFGGSYIVFHRFSVDLTNVFSNIIFRDIVNGQIIDAFFVQN